jgi:hypothetical protein
VLNISADQITHPKDILPDELSEVPLIQGLTHTAQGAVLLLDLEHLFASNQDQLAQVLEALAAMNDSLENDQQELAEMGDAKAAGVDESEEAQT